MPRTEEYYDTADGSHMWRIAENLITNAIKYTMKNTRVFIDISKNEKEGILVIKNVSSIPIDEVDVKEPYGKIRKRRHIKNDGRLRIRSFHYKEPYGNTGRKA